MSAYKMAHQLGVDGIEVDIHLSQDEVPVLIHDSTVNRTTNGKGKVSNKTIAELKKLDAGSWFSTAFKDERIPTLDEFFSWIKDTTLIINLELKTSETGGIEQKVSDLILKYGLSKRIIISSFSQVVLVNIEKINPSLETALLYKYSSVDPLDIRERLKASAIHPHYSLVSKAYMTKFQNQGIKVRPFTVNNEKLLRKFITWKIDGIITDHLDKALRIRETVNQQSLHQAILNLPQRMKLLNWKNT